MKSRLKTLLRWSGVAIAAAGGLAAACGDDDAKRPELSLSDAPPEEPTDEAQRLAKLQMIRVYDHQPPAGIPKGWREVTAADVADIHMAEACELVNGSLPSGGSCALHAHDAKGWLCRVHLLADAAGLRATPLQLKNETGPDVDIPQQSSAGQAALLRMAVQALETMASTTVTLALDPGTGACFTSSGTPAGSNLDIHVPNLIASLAEMYYLRRELTDKASNAILAYADYQRGHPSLKIGQDRAYYGAELSRAEAARLWVGGNVGLDPMFKLCTSPELHGPAKTALFALRESGVSPGWIQSATTSTTTLLETGMATSASVKARLAKFWNQPSMTLAASGTLTKQLGLTLADFDVARAYLDQEIRVFARSQNAQKDIDPVAGSTNTTRWGATATEPVPLPDAYYAARGGVHDGSESLKVAIMPLPGNGYAEFVDAMGTFISKILRDVVFPAAVKDKNVDPLHLLLTDIGRERLGRFVYSPPIGVNPATFWVEGYASGDGMYALVGEDTVRCATTGKVEGAACTLKTTGLNVPFNPTDLIAAPLNVARTPVLGFGVAAQMAATGVGALPIATRFYLAKSSTGTPGSFKVFAASTVWSANGGNGSPAITSVVPEADRRAAKILAPSTKWCTLPVEECDGTEFDQRLPLENELTDDNNGVESSWKHYLALARQAANEADALGEAYVNAGVQKEERAEQTELQDKANEIQAMESLNELQDICGTSVDPVALLELFKDLSVMHGAGSGSACTTDQQCAITPTNGFVEGLKCYGAKCIKDPIATAAVKLPEDQKARLLNCLGDQALISFVTLGDVPVCVWTANNNVNDVCRGYTPSFTPDKNPCPQFAHNNVCEISAPPGHTVQPPITTTLGYFHPSSTIPAHPPTSGLCDDLRLLRPQAGNGTIKSGTNAQQFANFSRFLRMVQSDLFHPTNMASVARRIGWTYGFGGYSAITIDGVPKYTTGDIWRGAETVKWPCNSATRPASCTGGGHGLFCDGLSSCGAISTRAKMNEEMYRAVQAARVIAAAGDRTGVASPMHMWTSLDSCGPIFNGTLRGRWQRPGSSVLGMINVYDISGRGLNVTGYRVDSTDPADKLAWRSSKYSYASQGSFLNTHLTDAPVSTEFMEWFTDGDDCHKIFVERPVAVPGFSNAPPEVKRKEWLNDLSSDPGVVTKAAHAGYFAGVLSGSRAYKDVGIDKNDPNVFNSYSVLAEDRIPDTRAQLRPFDFEPYDLFNGLELLCDVAVGHVPTCDPANPPTISSPEDLGLAQAYLNCVAGSISQQAGRGVLAKFPQDAIDALRKQSVIGSFPANGGDWGVALSNLNSALVALSQVEPQLSGEIRLLGYDLNAVRVSLRRAGINMQMQNLQFMSTVADRLAQCAEGMITGAVTFGLGALVPCTNAIAQISIASQLNDLAEMDNQLAKELEINNFGSTFATRAQNLERYARQFAEQVAIVDASLATLEKLRGQARKALAKALFMRTNVASNAMSIDVAYRNRFNTARLRYEEAHKNAKRLAFIAKRAVEQRLGIQLRNMREKLPLVEAPANWESQICTARGIDFTTDVISSGSVDGGTAPNPNMRTNYADLYIGDYVTRLENVVESYRLVHGFHEGMDTAVVSLRDDIQRVRAECEVPLDNVMRWSSALDQRSTEDAPGWDRLACATTTTGGVTTEIPTCIDVFPTQSLAFQPKDSEAGLPKAYQIRFGTGTATCDPATCGLRTDTALAQKVNLIAGKYVLSWHAESAVAIAAPGFVSVRGRDRVLIANGQTPSGMAPTGELQRYYMVFDVANDQPGTIEIRTPGTARMVKMGAFQLERVKGTPATPTPTRYTETGATSTRRMKLCEDTQGVEFRGSGWRVGCVNLCADGFNSDCDTARSEPYCYRETSFSINQRDIEDGKMFVSSGFARGNFNYRIESVGINFVGSNTRDCTDSTTPATCLSGGFIPYSLYHTGPFFVRNHEGEEPQVMLFDGRIEHARGLASERYLTNPLGSADNDLISQYLRGEFQGRPLDGSFTLRVWDEPGVNFEGIRDVQVVLKYRYWTRLN